MSNLKNFIVPEYYLNFKCKTSLCRRPCCEGWPVSISMEDYFRLLGAPCSKKLRAKIDCALKIKAVGDCENYAEMSCDFNGRCKLHRADGLCAVQAELGEKFLPQICRYYPRAARKTFVYECSCAGSCEAIVEALANTKPPLKFIDATIPAGETPLICDISAEEYALSKKCIGIVQNQSLPLPKRLSLLGCEFFGSIPDATPDKPAALKTMHAFSLWFARESDSVREVCEEALSFYGEDTDLQRYEDAKTRFNVAFSGWHGLFENLLVNHMFYETFPFGEKHKDLPAAYAALTAVYAFLRYTAIGACALAPTEEKLVDTLSAMFRLVEHSGFDKNALLLLKSLNFNRFENLCSLLEL